MPYIDIVQIETLELPPGVTLELPPGMSRWINFVNRVHPHPASKVAALEIDGGRGEVRGLGVWTLETGELVRWEPAMAAFAWLPDGSEAVVVEDERQIVLRMRWPDWQQAAETPPLPDTYGCPAQSLEVSPDGQWIFAERWSGQGDWGYDLLSVEPLRRRLGRSCSWGYMTASPAFSQSGDRLVIGHGKRWAGNWWADLDDLDEDDESARGGPVTLGWLIDHRLETLTVTRHELRMELPAGWLPENLEEALDGSPPDISLTGGVIRMTLPGDMELEVAADPLPEVVWLPVPQTLTG